MFAFIQAEKATHPKKVLCRVMGFPKSSLYYRESVLKRAPPLAELENER